MATIATFALKAGVWFRRGRLLIVSPDSLGTACPLSGRNSTYRPVQILEASSVCQQRHKNKERELRHGSSLLLAQDDSLDGRLISPDSASRGCLSFSTPVPDRVEGTAGQVQQITSIRIKS